MLTQYSEEPFEAEDEPAEKVEDPGHAEQMEEDDQLDLNLPGNRNRRNSLDTKIQNQEYDYRAN